MAGKTDDAPEGDGAPETKVEITDAMVKAGTKALELWDSADLPENVVYSVYKAMELARRKAMAVPTLTPDRSEMAEA